MTLMEGLAMRVENATIAELQQALAEGRTTASALVRAYLERIEAYDRAGPGLNAVREVNPDALAIAASLDNVAPSGGDRSRDPDPPQGQHRDRRPTAHDRRLAFARRGARHPRREPRRAAATRRRGSFSARPI